MQEQMGNAQSYLTLITVLLLVLAAVFLTTRFIASRGRMYARGKYMQVKESIFIQRDKSILLVEAGGKYYLVGVTNQALHTLATIEKDALTPVQEDTERGEVLQSTKAAFQKAIEKLLHRKDSPQEQSKAHAKQKRWRQGAEPPETLPEEREEGQQEMLRLLKKPQADSIGPRAEKGNPFRKGKKMEGFAKDLYEAEERQAGTPLVPPEVTFELSEQAEEFANKRQRGQRKAPEKKKNKEDEIDRMMLSIEQRTKEIRQKRLQDHEDDADE